MALVASPVGLRRVVLCGPRRPDLRDLSLFGDERVEEDASAFGDLPRRFGSYFKGRRVAFDDTLDVADRSPFKRAVWQATRSIPYGETRSYAWVAQRVGGPGAARAVGQALARNPVPIVVPCHRVIASRGALGGFTGGLDVKERLLRLEGYRPSEG